MSAAFSEVEHPENEPVFTLTAASLISYLSHVTLQFVSILLIHPKVIPEASPPAPVLHPLFALGVHPTLLFQPYSPPEKRSHRRHQPDWDNFSRLKASRCGQRGL